RQEDKFRVDEFPEDEKLLVSGRRGFALESFHVEVESTVFAHLGDTHSRMVRVNVDNPVFVEPVNCHVGYDRGRAAVRKGGVLPDLLFGLPLTGFEVPAPPAGGGGVIVSFQKPPFFLKNDEGGPARHSAYIGVSSRAGKPVGRREVVAD